MMGYPAFRLHEYGFVRVSWVYLHLGMNAVYVERGGVGISCTMGISVLYEYCNMAVAGGIPLSSRGDGGEA